MELLISIIIPTYQRPELLARALASVHSQSFEDWEAIVVDDGSVPALHISHPSLFLDDRIHYRYQKNAGPGSARMQGIQMARGRVLCFLDDDDYYLENHLATLQTALEQFPTEENLLLTGMLTANRYGEMKREPLFDNRRDVLRQYWHRPVSLLPFAIPRSLALKYPIPTAPSPIEDFEWLCTLLSVANCHQLPDYTTVYVEHDTNRTNRLVDREWLLRREQAVTRAYSLTKVSPRISRRAYRTLMNHQRLHWSRQAIRAGDRAGMWFGIRRALPTLTLRNGRELLYTAYIYLKG